MSDWRFCRVVTGVFLSYLLAFNTHSAELTDLYQATVPAGQSQAQWQRQALQAVLLKLTGSSQTEKLPGLADAIKNSGQFVVQFQQVQHEGQSQLLVTLDGQKLTQLLQQQQIPVWGTRRPDVLLWLTERPVETPQFVLSPEHPLRKALQTQAAVFGLSLQFPLYDETDTQLVNETVSWSGDWLLLQQASARYQATEVYNLLFDQITDATGLVQYRLTWQQLVDGAVQSKELLNADAMALAQQFCAELAQVQAARYAVRVVAASGVADTQLQLTIAGVTSLTDLAKLRELFAAMLTVREHSVVQYSAGEAVLALQLSASTDEFYRALSLVRELTPQPDDIPAALGDGSVVDVSTQPAVPVISDAESAMEAALGDPTTVPPASSDLAVTASAVTDGNSPEVQPGTTAPVSSTRYSYRRQ